MILNSMKLSKILLLVSDVPPDKTPGSRGTKAHCVTRSLGKELTTRMWRSPLTGEPSTASGSLQGERGSSRGTALLDPLSSRSSSPFTGITKEASTNYLSNLASQSRELELDAVDTSFT